MPEIFSNTTLTVNQLIEKIDTGELGLPELQRPFIWKDSKVRDLFDSMMRGYPIGYLMLWECPSLDKKKSIGVDAHSYDTPKEVIIDGQQRLTSLYAVMKGKKVINSKFDEKSIVISYCPLQNKFEVGYQATKNDPEWIYNISDLFTSTNTFKFIGDFIKRLGDYRSTKGSELTDEEQGLIADRINGVVNLKSHTLPVFDIKSTAEEEDVSEIFVRVNSGGVSLKQNDFILTLLHAMARDVAETNPELKPISCATVHQFQGSEKDVIVYDAVDCYRMPYPGMLLTSTGNNYANRLFNVALTRAKGKFIGVANVAYMDNKNLSNNLMFERMIETQRRKPSCLKGTELTHQRKSISSSLMSFFDNNEGTKQFLNDIVAAKREIRIDIPDKPVDDAYARQLATALRTAKGKGITLFLRAENKQSLPSALKSLAIENPFLANPLALIDKRVVWFGMPASDAKFRSEGSILQTSYRPVIRFEGKYTATSLYGFMEMSKTVDQSKSVTVDDEGKAVTENFASYVLAKKKCPSCGRPMKLQKSKKGKFFLGCTGYPVCQETSLVDVDLVERYFYCNGGTGQHCARCNCSLEAKLGPYGLYIQCCGSMHHKYKLDEI